jgi:hypothetical protein
LGQRACQHAQLGIPETAHGPSLEHHQLPNGSITHSLTHSPAAATPPRRVARRRIAWWRRRASAARAGRRCAARLPAPRARAAPAHISRAVQVHSSSVGSPELGFTRVGSCAAVTLWMSAVGWGLGALGSCAYITSSAGAFELRWISGARVY